MQTMLAEPALWVSIILFALTNITLSEPYSVTMPFLVKDHLHADADTLGLLYAIFPAGYVLGGIWMGCKPRFRQRGWTAYCNTIVAGLGLLAFGLPILLLVIGLAALANGAALEINGVVWTNILQETVPNEKLGRVSSIDMLGSFALLPVGYALAGWATDTIGPAPVFVIGGLTVLFALIALSHPAIRKLD